MASGWRWHSVRGWAAIGAVVGALIPVAATVYYIGFGVLAGLELLIIWPTSLGLMAAETAIGPIANATIWLVCAAPNVVLYALAGALLRLAYELIAGKRT